MCLCSLTIFPLKKWHLVLYPLIVGQSYQLLSKDIKGGKSNDF